MPTLTTAYAQLLLDPLPPRASKANPDWAPQHAVKVRVSNDAQDETHLYFLPGDLSFLKKGDKVLCSYTKGRWRLSEAQAPELLATLKARSTTTPPPMQTTEEPLQEPSARVPKTEWDPDQKRAIALMIAQNADLYKFCLSEARRACEEIFKEPSHEDLRAIATTLFIQAQQDLKNRA